MVDPGEAPSIVLMIASLSGIGASTVVRPCDGEMQGLDDWGLRAVGFVGECCAGGINSYFTPTSRVVRTYPYLAVGGEAGRIHWGKNKVAAKIRIR